MTIEGLRRKQAKTDQIRYEEAARASQIRYEETMRLLESQFTKKEAQLILLVLRVVKQAGNDLAPDANHFFDDVAEILISQMSAHKIMKAGS